MISLFFLTNTCFTFIFIYLVTLKFNEKKVFSYTKVTLKLPSNIKEIRLK